MASQRGNDVKPKSTVSAIHVRKHAAPGGSKVTGLLAMFEQTTNFEKESKPKAEVVAEKRNKRKSFTAADFKSLHAQNPNQWDPNASIKTKEPSNQNNNEKPPIVVKEVKKEKQVKEKKEEPVVPKIVEVKEQSVPVEEPKEEPKIEEPVVPLEQPKEQPKLDIVEQPKEEQPQVVNEPIIEQPKEETTKVEEPTQTTTPPVQHQQDNDDDDDEEGAEELDEPVLTLQYYLDSLNHTNFDLIDLGSKNIDDNGLIALLDKLESTGRINTLEKLVLSGNEFEDRGAMRLASALRENKSIDFLDLKWNMIGIKGIESLGLSLEFNETLTSLNLDGNELGEEGAISLAEHFEKNKSLRYIELKDNFIGDTGAEAIAAGLKYHPNLVLLDLTSNEITGRGAEQISYLLINRSEDMEAPHNLETLILNTNLIGDEGAVAIANALASNQTLTSLQLRSCGIAGDGMVQLAKILTTRNNHLAELDLNSNLTSIKGEIALNDLAMSNESLYVEWKDPSSESSWNLEDIKEIINHYGALEILGNILHGFSLAPLIENQKLLGSLEIEDFDVAESFIDEALSEEFTLVGLDMLNTILRRGLSPAEADDFDELEDDDLYLDENTSPLEELPPLQRALYKWIPTLQNILSSDLGEMNTSQGPIQPFGEMRLKTLEVIIALIDEEGPTSLLEKFVELNTPRTIIEFLEKFPLHNICHTQVRQFVRVSLRSDTLRAVLFNDCDILNFLRNLAETEWNKSQSTRRACSGHIGLIIQDVLKFSFDKDVKLKIKDSPEWNTFISTTYNKYINEIKK